MIGHELAARHVGPEFADPLTVADYFVEAVIELPIERLGFPRDRTVLEFERRTC
jgi:hypothetical protein